MSFQEILPGQTEWIGLQNFRQLFGDRIFLISVQNTLKFTVGMLLLLIPIPMVLVCIINSKIMNHTKLFKTIYFIPALASVVVAGTVFRLIFGESDTALMNQVLQAFGAEPIKWLKPGSYRLHGFADSLLALDRRKYDVLCCGAAKYLPGSL